jgi:hypothetical protein
MMGTRIQQRKPEMGQNRFIYWNSIAAKAEGQISGLTANMNRLGSPSGKGKQQLAT